MDDTIQDPPPLNNPAPIPNCLTQHTTPTPSPNQFGPPLSFIQVGSNAPVCHTPFPFPTLSPAEWYRINSFTPFIQAPVYPESAPMPTPESVVRPNKRRGRPPKVRPIPVLTPATASSLATTSNEVELSSSHMVEVVGQCWFTKREDGRSDMDMVALWCSEFDNFTTWRTKPKQIGGEQVSSFLISHGHPKREGRECEKRASGLKIDVQSSCMLTLFRCCVA